MVMFRRQHRTWDQNPWFLPETTKIYQPLHKGVSPLPSGVLNICRLKSFHGRLHRVKLVILWIVTSVLNILSQKCSTLNKGLFTWRWGTPGRWGTPPTWGKRKLAFTCNIYNPGALGWGFQILLLGDNFSLIRARSLSSRLSKSLFISFKGFSGSVSLSRPNSSKKSIAKLNAGLLSLCTSPTRPA